MAHKQGTRSSRDASPRRASYASTKKLTPEQVFERACSLTLRNLFTPEMTREVLKHYAEMRSLPHSDTTSFANLRKIVEKDLQNARNRAPELRQDELQQDRSSTLSVNSSATQIATTTALAITPASAPTPTQTPAPPAPTCTTTPEPYVPPEGIKYYLPPPPPPPPTMSSPNQPQNAAPPLPPHAYIPKSMVSVMYYWKFLYPILGYALSTHAHEKMLLDAIGMINFSSAQTRAILSTLCRVDKKRDIDFIIMPDRDRAPKQAVFYGIVLPAETTLCAIVTAYYAYAYTKERAIGEAAADARMLWAITAHHYLHPTTR